ncbi:MAG: YwpF family protein, partial [Solibacillus isronensis]
MKTFKMLAFDLLLNDEIKEIPLTDGIIINQENSHKMWILELFTADTYYDFFQKFVTSGEVLDARAI